MRNQRWNACVSESFREWETGKVTILISYFQAYLTNYARLFLENNEDEKGFKKTTNLPSWSLLGHCQMCTRSQIGWTRIRCQKMEFFTGNSQNKPWKTKQVMKNPVPETPDCDKSVSEAESDSGRCCSSFSLTVFSRTRPAPAVLRSRKIVSQSSVVWISAPHFWIISSIP